MVANGDFNGESSNWYNNDIISNGCWNIEGVASQNGLHHEINEPTHILNNSGSHIDLIFNPQPNLLIESGVYQSSHPNGHHQITFAKFNLDKVHPPPYEKEIWHYQKANIDPIKRGTNLFVGKKRLPILKLARCSLFLIRLLLINYVILFIMVLSYLTILLGWTRKSKNWFMKKKNIFNWFCQNNIDKKLLYRLKDLQTQLNSFI